MVVPTKMRNDTSGQYFQQYPIEIERVVVIGTIA